MFSFVALDLETTGLDCWSDDIIEIGMVKVIDGQERDFFQSLVRPGGPLPVKIKQLTGLKDDDFQSAPLFQTIIPKILTFIGDLPLVGHNIKFDRDFLAAACGHQLPNDLYDTFELARILQPSAPSHRLGELCKIAGVEVNVEHRALDDARSSARLMLKLLSNLTDTEPEVVWQLSHLLREAGSAWHPVFQEISNQLLKKFPDKKLGQRIPGAPPLEPTTGDRQKQDKTAISLTDCLNILGPQGAMESTMPRFQYRPQQCDMMGEVVKAFNEDKILLVEAGTGTGKSLAYLVPAIVWARQNDERVLITTHTINLQEQLWHKDLPLLANLPDFEFKAALMKGRSNYLCLRRWFALMAEPNHQPEEAHFLARLLVWLHQTITGDKSELFIPYQESEYWYRVCSESDGCLGSRCRFFAEKCFFAAARRAAEQADVVIVNHSLLLSDVNTDNMVLPSYGPLIIDEAHHLENTATEHLGYTSGRSEVSRWLTATGRQLQKLEQLVVSVDPEGWQKLLKQSIAAKQTCMDSVTVLFEMLHRWAGQSAVNSDFGRYNLRFDRPENPDGVCSLPLAIDTELDNLLVNIRTFNQLLIKLSARLEEVITLTEDAAGVIKDMASAISLGQELANKLEFIGRSQGDGYVYWLEGSSETDILLRAAPIDVGPLLQEKLFSAKRPVVLTSATLSVNGSFDYFIKSIGLDLLPKDSINEKQLDSPFNYSEQVLLCAARDIPQPGDLGDKAYHDVISSIIYRLSLAAGGRTLVLFTSHRSLREVYHRLKEDFEEQDICLLGHELDGSRGRLVEQFKEGHRTVLFGAASFWEGVDIPGETLSCVIIVKLPFSPPNQPVVEARLQRIARQGGNGFHDYQIPQAVIKFKQGFGRLIRDPEDKGAVVILDSRLVEKRYGVKFFNSLPVTEHFRGSWQQILSKVYIWLNPN
ncbi:DNA polymerase III, epsilon subunit [Desulfotomaculum nigrificans CO-1-SRB]|uniref:3'-5' exonuclease DinG n=1 Tax=Desulfotomaculum nigrificans (strain DSM 14880 / VKM B-2319 / CO-1-SRB) TaxID=868595 RepID=F6B4T3_DESCC|nr:helicase C-terminal domain-containing protein [Desulfotomaculum nigrificans]AEF94195.1 DNA polymerase III, epsilon subunit [Desulfotomaculum nigrificans CO-1-SRB]